MNNKIKITGVNTQYSIIEVSKPRIGISPAITNHIVSNNGWFNLEYWVKYFTYDF